MQTDLATNADSNFPTSDPTRRFFWLAMACHVIAYMMVCIWTQPNLPLDMVEMIYWGQQWELGYHKHPPLPAWIAATAWKIGGGHPWLVYLVAQSTIVVTFWAVWQFAREKLSPWTALCSVAILEGCYYCSFLINDLNNTIVTRPFWALTVLFLYRAITRESSSARNLNWVLTGIAIGLGMISKYYIGILVLSMFCLPLVATQARRSVATIGPWITTAIATLIFLPHAIWMFNNDFITLQYVVNRSGEAAADYSWTTHIVSPIDFFVRQLPAVLPVIVLATPLFLHRRKQTASVNGGSNDFFKTYLLVTFAGPILIYLALALCTGSEIRSMWGGPLFSYVGVVIFTLVPLNNEPKVTKKILRDSLCVGVVMVMALAGRNILGPVLREKQSRVHFPGQELSELINEEWNQRYDFPLPAVGGRLFVAGCVGVYSPQHVDVYGAMSEMANPWISDKLFQERGGVIAWERGEAQDVLAAEWRGRYSHVEVLENVSINSMAAPGSKSIELGIAIVHPTNSEYAKRKISNSDARSANLPASKTQH